MADIAEKKVSQFALISRLAIFLLQLLSNTLIPDHHPDVFNPPSDPGETTNFLDNMVNLYFGGFIRWDAVYFLHIAEHGYVYQNSLAFFPLLPWAVRLVANTFLYPLQFVLAYRSVLILSGYFLNLILFVQAAKSLFHLGRKVLGDTSLAYKAALLFCINPASIFMSALYSETLFIFLVFSSLGSFENRRTVISSVLFGLCGLARSNGVIMAGYEIYQKLKQFIQHVTNFSNDERTPSESTPSATQTMLSAQLFITTFLLILVFYPFFVYQYCVYFWFCTKSKNVSAIPEHILNYGRLRDYHVVGDADPVWCHSALPMSYNFVQSGHWGVGFLKYYEVKQIPNFILALPVTYLCAKCIVTYYKLNKVTCYTLGLFPNYTTTDKKSDDKPVPDVGFTNSKLLPYVAHVLFLLVFGWCFIHIQVKCLVKDWTGNRLERPSRLPCKCGISKQVLTRLLLSSSPLLYWFAAYCCTTTSSTARSKVSDSDADQSQNKQKEIETEANIEHPIKNKLTDQLMNFRSLNRSSQFVFLFFISYFLIGTITFSNFFPWT